MCKRNKHFCPSSNLDENKEQCRLSNEFLGQKHFQDCHFLVLIDVQLLQRSGAKII